MAHSNTHLQRTFNSSNFGEVLSNRAISSLSGLEGVTGGLAKRFAASVGNDAAKRRDLQAGTSSAIAQKFQNTNSFRGNFRNLSAKAKARSQIANRGENAIKNQQLKDRLTLARSGVARQGTVLGGIASSQRNRLSIASAQQTADDAVGQAKFGAIGGIAGGLVGAAKNGLFNFSSKVKPGIDQGTAAADAIGTDPFNFITNPLQTSLA